MDAAELLRYAVERRASDVHIKAGNVPFISTAGTERLCSGVTMITPSADAISPFIRTTAAGGSFERSTLNIGRSSICTRTNAKRSAPSR